MTGLVNDVRGGLDLKFIAMSKRNFEVEIRMFDLCGIEGAKTAIAKILVSFIQLPLQFLI